METQECKVFFPLGTTKQQAEAILSRYATVKIDNFMEDREIGCNTVTFAVVTLPMKVATKLIEEKIVSRIDVISNQLAFQ